LDLESFTDNIFAEKVEKDGTARIIKKEG